MLNSASMRAGLLLLLGILPNIVLGTEFEVLLVEIASRNYTYVLGDYCAPGRGVMISYFQK